MRQGQGYCSALLARAFEVCDREHAVAYLEASNPGNLAPYRRFGFGLGEIQQGTSPVVILMVRAARSACSTEPNEGTASSRSRCGPSCSS